MAKTVMLVLRSGGDFRYRDAHLLADRICQEYKRAEEQPPEIYCLSDTVAGLTKHKNITFLPMENHWPGWWAKMNLFSPAMEQYRPFLYLDLDTACIGLLDDVIPTEPNKGNFIMLRDFHFHNRFASGVMWVPKNSEKVSSIWQQWCVNPAKHIERFRGDQDFLKRATTPDLCWQDFTAGAIRSFKPGRQLWLKTLPEETKLVCFHGHPRIREAIEIEWVLKYVEGALLNTADMDKRYDSLTNIHPWFSLLCPTRGRPDLATRYARSVYETAAWPARVEVLFYVDSDDPSLPEYAKQLRGLPCRILIGPSRGVGRAWNELAGAAGGEYLMMANDDLVHETQDWDKLLLDKLVHFPDQIVFAYVNDGVNVGGTHCAFPIIGKRWAEQLEEFVTEKYNFFRHDTDLFEVAKQIGSKDRILYIPDIMIRHLHFASNKEVAMDATYKRNRSARQNERDAAVYARPESSRQRRNKGQQLRRVIAESDHYNGEVFASLIRGKKVALIGPSPHLVGKGLGEEFDKYDVVCRVNELYPFDFEQDYGSKTDIVFYGCNANNLPNFEKTLEMGDKRIRPDFFMAAQRRNDVKNLVSLERFTRIIHKHLPDTTIGIINRDQWGFYSRWIGTHPNTGILALCMLVNAAPSELLLTGFSFYSQGLKPDQRHYSGYIEYGGDEAYNNITITRGHDQFIQMQWFIEQFLPVYGNLVTFDSFLCDTLGIKPPRILEVPE